MQGYLKCNMRVKEGEDYNECTRYKGHLGNHLVILSDGNRYFWKGGRDRNLCANHKKNCGICNYDKECFDAGDMRMAVEPDDDSEPD